MDLPGSVPRPSFLPCSDPFLPQEKTTSLPNDVAQDLRGVENQLQRHEGLARELAGMEQQVSKLLPVLQPGLFVLLTGTAVHGRAWQAWVLRQGTYLGMLRSFRLMKKLLSSPTLSC